MKEIKFKLTKWGAKRLVHYYEDICDWGCSYYNEDKYTPILQDILYHTMKTGELIIPEKYPEIQNILSSIGTFLYLVLSLLYLCIFLLMFWKLNRMALDFIKFFY